MKTRCAVTAFLAIVAVYLAVGPHEIGHATAAWLYGCKADAWRTGMRWYLAGSQGGAIDEACLNRHGRGALGAVALAGIVVNFLLISLAPLAGRWWLPARTASGGVRWGLVASVLVALANGAEALSYLVVNSLWLKTDMAIVVAAAGIGRWPWTVAGLILGAVFVRALAGPIRSASAALAGPGFPDRLWRWALIGYALAIGLAAVLSRMSLS
jgi:hypothetical protein